MDYRKNENQKYYYFIIFAMAVVMAFTFKFYVTQRKENQALRIKLMMANKERRKPKPWGRLTAVQPVRNLPTTTNSDVISTKQAAPVRTQSPVTVEELIKNRDTESLASELTNQMRNIRAADLPQISRTIEIADEIILREPESYSAYKAKLIAFLTREGKYSIPANDDDVNNLLEEMARFDLSSDKVMQKEASLISSANAEVMALEQRLLQTRSQRETLESQMNQLGPQNPDYTALDTKRAVLTLQEEDALGKIATVENQIETGDFPPDNYVNEDIVQIPFMRLMARDDFAAAADNAESFVQQFPNSPVGYFYLVLALEKMGRKDEAVDILARSRLGNNDQSKLLERLSTARLEDPKHYWEKLNF